MRPLSARLLGCLFMPVFLLACAGSGQSTGSLVVGDVTVIDPESRRVLEHRDVHVRDGYIVAIDPADASNADSSGYIAASDKFLVPGLMDMHVHLAHSMFSQTTLALLLANGVTGVREMSGDCWEPRGEMFACIDDYRKLQSDIEAGLVLGPHIEKLASAIVRGPAERRQPHVPEGAPAFVTPGNAAEAQQLAQLLKDRGVDLIKTYDGLPRAAYFALAEQARTAGLEIAGHVPSSVTAIEASVSGHRTIEHARTILRDCSVYAEEMRARAERRQAGDTNVRKPAIAEHLNGIVDTFDLARCRQLLAALAANGTFYAPTHETREMDARASEPAYRDDGRLRYIPGRLREFWQQDLRDTADASSQEDVDAYQRFFLHGLAITRLAFESGVGVMAGTDANDTLSIPGFSLHDELLHLARAGIPPMDVLRAATTVPAEYLSKSDVLGGIAVGKQADMLILHANPLEDIANTGAISGVVFKGRWLSRDELDRVLERVAVHAE